MTRTRGSIELTARQRRELEVLTKTGTRSAKLLKRVAVILALNTSDSREPDTQADIANHVDVSRQTVQMVKKVFTETPDIATFLQRKKRENPAGSRQSNG